MSCVPHSTSASVTGWGKREADITLTFKGIAHQAGVNLATTDHVLHTRAHVRLDTVRRVKEALEPNEFRPHVTAAELAAGEPRAPAL